MTVHAIIQIFFAKSSFYLHLKIHLDFSGEGKCANMNVNNRRAHIYSTNINCSALCEN